MIEKLIRDTRVALIINEMQVGNMQLLPALGKEVERRGTVKHIAKLAEKFREKNLPVFHTPAMHRADFADLKRNTLISAMAYKAKAMIAGSEQAAYLPGLEPHASDLVSVRSSGLFCFQGTDLDARLRRMGVETIIAAGVSTNLGIPAIAFAATDLGYNVVVAEDCISSVDQAIHEMLIREQLRLVATITTSADVMALLEQRPGQGAA